MHPELSTLSTNAHRCFITGHKRGHKTIWTKTHSTHDLKHALQLVLSLKSQQGVFETISIRSLGFVCLTTSVVKKELVKELGQGSDKGPRYRGYWMILVMSWDFATWSPQVSHTSNTSCHCGLGRRSCTWLPSHHVPVSGGPAVPSACFKSLCLAWSLQKECPNLLPIRFNHGKSMNSNKKLGSHMLSNFADL